MCSEPIGKKLQYVLLELKHLQQDTQVQKRLFFAMNNCIKRTYDSRRKVGLVVQPSEPLCRDHGAVVLQSGLVVVDNPRVAA